MSTITNSEETVYAKYETANSIGRLDLKFICEDIIIDTATDDKITIEQVSHKKIPDRFLMSVKETNGVLKACLKPTIILGWSYNYSATIKVYIPKNSRIMDISITTVSGGIYHKRKGEYNDFNCSTTSGECKIIADFIDNGCFKSVSGDMEIAIKSVNILEIKQVSGDINFEGDVKKRVETQAVNGKVVLDLDKMCEKIEISSVSGKANLYLPQDSAFSLNYKSVMGILNNEFATNNGVGGVVEFSTTSGNCKIYKK